MQIKERINPIPTLRKTERHLLKIAPPIIRFTRKNLLPIGAIAAAVFTLAREDDNPWLNQQVIANNLNNQDKQISINADLVSSEIHSGSDLIDHYNLRNQIVYLIYGRPLKYEGQESWGSLSESMTAQESWELYQRRKEYIESELSKAGINDKVGLGVINPVYLSNNDPINDIYIQKALELAPVNNGIVALSFNSIQLAKDTINKLQIIIPQDQLKYLSVSLDIEWFNNSSIEANTLNEFSNWYAQLHKQWDPSKTVPGFVFVYTINPISGIGRIASLDKVQQYYYNEGVFVVPVADGYGTDIEKMHRLSQLINGENGVAGLTNSPEFPALAGTMEFVSKWGQTYDKATIPQIYDNLRGAPMKIFVSQ